MTGRLLPGIDTVLVAEVHDSLERFGDKYLGRIHRDGELAGLDQMTPARRDQHLAGRFAAKEAAFKAMRMPSGVTMGWTAIEIVRGDDGAPVVRLHGQARAWAQQTDIDDVTVSITHDADRAMAMAIAHQTTPGRGDSRPDTKRPQGEQP